MSFLTALLGGLGGYMQGRQQRQQNQQQQQYQQSEMDLQHQELLQRQRQTQIAENTYRDAARAVLSNRGVNPDTAQWDPGRMQFSGGQQYSMPKGWENVPTDPQQAVGHYNRLMSYLMGQGRGGTDIAAMTDEDRKAAIQQLIEQQKFGQQVALKKLDYQHSDWLAWYNKNTVSAGEQFTAGAADRRQQLSFDQQNKLSNANHAFELAKSQVPTLQMQYNATSREPNKALDAARATAPKLDAQVNADIKGLNAHNFTMASKFMGPPNPGMDKFVPLLNDAIAKVKKDPAQLQTVLKQAAAARDSAKNGGPGFSEDQYTVFVRNVTQIGSNEAAVRAAQHAVDLVNQYFHLPSVPGVGGSNAPANPTYPPP